VISRNFDSTISVSSADPTALQNRPPTIIPLLDVFNHHPLSPTISFDAISPFSAADERDTRKFAVSAAQRGAVSNGEELFNYYGTKPNWDMLAKYGFVSSNPACQVSVLCLLLALLLACMRACVHART
jgi:hypothetical protein